MVTSNEFWIFLIPLVILYVAKEIFWITEYQSHFKSRRERDVSFDANQNNVSYLL